MSRRRVREVVSAILALGIHHARRLDARTHEGLPVTTPLQTIGQLRGDEADRARAEALVRRLIPRSADDAAEPTRSELEGRLLAALGAAGLPRPQVNERVQGREVDLSWPAHSLVVETGGWAAHSNHRAFERDGARDAALTAAGYTVLRFTWRQVAEETLKVCVQIAQALGRHPPPRAGDPPTRGVGGGPFPEYPRPVARVSS